MLRDRVEQTSTTTGTGTYSLTGTVADRNTFVGAGLAAKQCYYLAVNLADGDFEFGIGTVADLATDTLSRDTIIGSSNGGLAVNWAAGTRNIMVAPPMELLGAMGGRLQFGIAGGTADAITLTTPVPVRALTGAGGVCVFFEAIGTNTGAVTLNVDGNGALALRKGDGSVALAAGDIQDGQLVVAIYDVTRGVWQMINASPGLATAADYRAGTSATKVLTPSAVYDGMAPVALTYGASIPFDMATGFDFDLTMTGDGELANPSNPKVGKKGRIKVTQDGTGGRLLTFASQYVFSNGSPPVLSTAAGAVDLLYYDCLSASQTFISQHAAIG